MTIYMGLLEFSFSRLNSSMNRKTKDINESELKNWRLLKELKRKLFDGILKESSS